MYTCETCGGEASIVYHDGIPVSKCCGDYVLDGTSRYSEPDPNDETPDIFSEYFEEENLADTRNDELREGALRWD